jgi:hypothetical protein
LRSKACSIGPVIGSSLSKPSAPIASIEP